MARLSYKGYNISCKPLKTDNLWQLEIEKSGGEIVHTWAMDALITELVLTLTNIMILLVDKVYNSQRL